MKNGSVKRIRRNPRALLAPCSTLGRPLGPPMPGVARLVSPEWLAVAEHALCGNYGLGRHIYGLIRAPLLDAVYVSVMPDEEEA